MSRYQWPGRIKADRVSERMDYRARTNGVLPPDVVTPRSAVSSQPVLTRAAPAGDSNVWVPIGPSVVVSGQTVDHSRVAGRVRDLVVNDTGTRAYAASADGGVWYTGDAGITWSPLGNWIPTPDAASIDHPASVLSCGCLLVTFGVPEDGSLDDVYVGTGELTPETGRPFPGGPLGGVGVLHLDKTLPVALADPFGPNWKREAKNLVGAGIYRLARDPADANRLVAATSIGLFTRSVGFVEDADWQKVTASPFNFDPSDKKLITDLVWVNAAPSRLAVALLAGSDTGIYISTTGVDGHYDQVKLTDQIPNQGGLVSRVGLAAAPSDSTILYVLASGPRLWRIAGLAITQIAGLPAGMFAGDGADQSSYDLAIAVHPDDRDTIFVGGSSVPAGNGTSDAALFRFTVANPPANPNPVLTFIGRGVHPDVHQIKFAKSNGNLHVWLSCDGGVFRSESNGDNNTFGSRNTGLAVLETGFVASHPESDAFVIAGAQDNGVLMRIGDTVWLHSVIRVAANRAVDAGDAGGAVFHPVQRRFFAAQGVRSGWISNGTLTPPVLRNPQVTTSETKEDQAALFYSAADARRVGNTNQVRLALGTNRVWLVDSWDPAAQNTAWVTLPSNKDARTPGSESDSQDRIGDGQVVVCRWADDNRLLAVVRSENDEGRNSVVRMFTRQADGSWTSKDLSNHHNRCFAFTNSDIPDFESDFLPPLGGWSDIAINVAGAGDFVSCYVACTGHIGAGKMDTLWWYNGQGKWYPTGMATPNNAPPASSGTKAPAYAVATDPGDETVVYVGTAVGVWRGTQAFDQDTSPPTPRWIFRPFSNGLPEAAVQDLSFFHPGPDGLHPGPNLLRAALQSRGVWEVDLGTPPGPTRRTFLRVHPSDSRRAAVTSRVIPVQNNLQIWPLHSTPDVRIRQAKLEGAEAAPAAPANLPWIGQVPRGADRFLFWIFQTALHNVDRLCRPDGNWSPQFAARLTLYNQLHGAGEGNRITVDRWNDLVTPANVFADPWDGPSPTEADLLELVIEPIQAADLTMGPPQIALMPPRKLNVDVLVHHRDSRPVAATDVTVGLLRRRLADQSLEPAIPITDAWKDQVLVLMGGGVPAPPDQWEVADPIRTRHLPDPVDARTPRAATFTVDFTGEPLQSRWILLAIVTSAADGLTKDALVGNTLTDLVLGCHQVAGRVLEVRQ